MRAQHQPNGFFLRMAGAALLVSTFGQACARGPRISPEELTASHGWPDLEGKPELAWSVKLPSPPTALLPVGGSAALVTTYRGELYRFNLKAGARDSPIRQPVRKAISAQLVEAENGRFYVGSAQEGDLRAYHLGSGRLLWKRDQAGVTGPLAMLDGLLLAAGLGGRVTAHDPEEGGTVWHHQLPGRIYQGVWRVGNLALVLTDNGKLYAFEERAKAGSNGSDPADHPPLWERELGVGPNAVAASGGGWLVVGDGDGLLLGIDPAQEEPQFRIRLDSPIYSRPLVTKDMVVVATAAGEVVAIQVEDGLPLWRVRGEGLVKAPLLATENGGNGPPQAVLVPFARGQLLALELATGRELWRYDLERPIVLANLTPGGVAVVDHRNELSFLRLVSPAE
ncbi:MAG: PQQ-binding-like beta-propeller repeat protein [Candidatus Neomarinimicrobiota bacterium]